MTLAIFLAVATEVGVMADRGPIAPPALQELYLILELHPHPLPHAHSILRSSSKKSEPLTSPKHDKCKPVRAIFDFDCVFSYKI